ncbi:MAG TPA: glycosyltransferase, partial [Candidatus Acidoferrales bacterium]|nr:glycosyltransferase [Candidatus Acidoferrales bacterium]
MTSPEREALLPRILILHQWKAERGLYGADRVLVRMVREMTSMAHPLVVVESEGELPDALRELGCEVLVRPMGVLRRKQMNPVGLLRSAWQIAMASLWMAGEIRRQDIRLVITCTVAVIPGAFAAALARRPHLWFVEEVLGGRDAALSLLVSALSTRVVAVSEASARSVHRERNWAKRKTQVAYPGVEARPPGPATGGGIRQEFGVPKEEILIGMVGRLHY